MGVRKFSIAAWLLVLAASLGASGAPDVRADEPANKSGDEQVAKYFRAETAKLSDACLADVKTLDDWNANKAEYRRQLFEMLSLDPLPERTDLKATITGRVERDDFVVEKLHFQSRPGLYVTANLYLPKTIEKPCPTILYLCGHGKVAKDGVSFGNKVHYQHHGIWFARHGYACLVIDTLQLGEIEGIHHGTYRHDRWWWNSRGYSPAGVEAWNCIRALDYLATRKEVDAERIGATGRSGGGAYTWFIAALDDRIKAAVPVAGITDLENHVVDGCVEGHCDCMYFVNTYRWDYPQMAALVAPRPLLISNTDKDNIFPLEGVLRTHRVVRRIYALHDAEKNLGLHITEGPHEDTQELYTHAFVWFDRFLGGGRRPIDGPAVKLFEPEELKVFDKLPADEINTKIDETFVAVAAEPNVPQSKEQWERMRDGWMKDLREKVFRAWPEKAPALNVKEIESRGDNEFRYRGRQFEFTSESNLRQRLAVETDNRNGKREVKSILFVVGIDFDRGRWTVNESRASRDSIEKKLTPGSPRLHDATVFFSPRGYEMEFGQRASKDLPLGTHDHRRYALLGQTPDGMRVWDIRRAIQALGEIPEFRDASVTVYGQSTACPLAVYASLFEPSVKQVVLERFHARPQPKRIFLNVQRSHDIVSALAMVLEKRRVHIQDSLPSQFEFARQTGDAMKWIDVADDEKEQPRLTIDYDSRPVKPLKSE